MSADNTIGILVTLGRDNALGMLRGLEFRVAHVQALENIQYEPDYPPEKPELNREWVRMLFAAAPYFTNEADAWRYALKLEAKIEREIGFPVEYGVQRLDFSKVCFPASDRKRRRRGWHPVMPRAVAS